MPEPFGSQFFDSGFRNECGVKQLPIFDIKERRQLLNRQKSWVFEPPTFQGLVVLVSQTSLFRDRLLRQFARKSQPSGIRAKDF